MTIAPSSVVRLFSCELCRSAAPKLRDVNATSLGIPVRSFCEGCATRLEASVDANTADMHEARALVRGEDECLCRTCRRVRKQSEVRS